THGRQYLSLRHLPENHQRNPARFTGGLSHDEIHGCANHRPQPSRFSWRCNRPDLGTDGGARSAGVYRRRPFRRRIGGRAALAARIADELDADWSKVKPVFPPEWNEKKFGNPEGNYTFQTSASFATRGYYKAMRVAGAQARRVLINAVAAKWGVPAAELSTEPSIVVHKASNRRISYGEIAGFAKAPAELPKIEDKDLKRAADFRYIGKDLPRVEVPLKVTGAAKYGIDAQVPGMVYAAVLQSPYPGGTPETVDETRARQVADITDIVKLPEGVGVVGTSVEATQAAKK